jgi:hypothetical protein
LRPSARLSPLVFSRKQKLVLHIIIFPVIISFADRNKKKFQQQSHTCNKGKNIQNRTEQLQSCNGRSVRRPATSGSVKIV